MEIAIDIAHALIVAEENNMLHRDIKPANILFTDKGDATLADLGLARTTWSLRIPELHRRELHAELHSIFSGAG
jgi:serine/threonine protein kinase